MIWGCFNYFTERSMKHKREIFLLYMKFCFTDHYFTLVNNS